MRTFSVSVLALAAAACASPGAGPDAFVASPPRSAWIVGASGEAIGEAQFTEAPGGVLIRLEFRAGALPPGWHGLHLHGRGDCSDVAAGFQASGGHLGMDEHVEHGLLNPAGPESGDLPNIFAPPNAPFAAEMLSPFVTLRDGVVGRAPLLDQNGAALIVHAGPDDHRSQPIGGAGQRIACAALTRAP